MTGTDRLSIYPFTGVPLAFSSFLFLFFYFYFLFIYLFIYSYFCFVNFKLFINLFSSTFFLSLLNVLLFSFLQIGYPGQNDRTRMFGDLKPML